MFLLIDWQQTTTWLAVRRDYLSSFHINGSWITFRGAYSLPVGALRLLGFDTLLTHVKTQKTGQELSDPPVYHLLS
jgi:hypothetical protein